MNKILKIPVFRGENRERIYKKSWRGLSAANRLSVCDLSDALYINTEKLPLLMSEKHSAPADMSGTLRIGNTQYTYGKSFPCDDDINLADAEKYCLLGKVLEYECPSTQPGNFYYDASRMIVHRVICGGSENGYENPLGFYSAGDYVFALYERSFFATQELRYYQGFCECLPYWSQFVTKKHSLDLHKQIVADVLSGDGLKQFLLYSETTNYINETNPSANNCTPCDGFYATAYTNGDRRRAMSEAVLETLDLEEEYGEPFSGERSIVQFNKNTNSASVTENTVEKTFILLPERRALKLSVSGDGSDITYANILTMPHLSRAVMDASRIFGIEGERIIVSEENSYSGYSLPSGDSTSGSLAWMNTSQSNTSANGEYTAIFAYGGHVVVFSKGSMQEIHGSAQPYRIIGIGSFGCVGQNAICEVEKKLYFVSENGVYSYAGAYPQKISGDLPIENFDGSILAGYGNKLYLYVPSKRTVYSYSTDTESFGIYQKNIGVSFMRASRNGVFMQCENIVNGITYYKNYVLGAGEFGEWEFTSGMFDFGHLSGDKIRAVSLLCEINNGDAQVYLINENGQQKQIMSFDENGISCRRAIVPPMSGKLYKLRVCGHGDVKIYGLEIHAAKRGDMNG